MFTPEKERQLGRILEWEKDFYSLTIKPLGNYYHDFIRSYSEEDRGLAVLLDLVDYLFSFKFGRNNNSQEEGVVSQFKDMTLKLSLYIPAMKDELGIMKKIEDELLKSLEDVFKGLEERRLPVLMPNEFVNVALALSNLRIYTDYRCGYNEIRSAILIERKSLRSLLDRYKNITRKFIQAVEQNSTFYIGMRILPYAFVTFFSIDAHDNSLLRDFLKTGNKELLLTYIPRSGLNEVLFNNEAKVKKIFRRALKYRTHMKEMCLPSSLKSRLNLGKLKKYYEDLYPPPSYLV